MMRKLEFLGPAKDPVDGIEDAEFEEVVEGEQAPKPQPQRPPDYTITEWLIDMHPAKAAVVVVIALLVFVGFIGAITGPDGDADASAEVVDTTAQSTTADQMLAEWSRHVTGQTGTSGFALVDGSGAAGTSCNDGGGTHLLQFGQPGATTPLITDFFSMQQAGSDIGVAGAFWFNNQTNELLVRNAQAVDLKHSKDRAVPDEVFRITGGGDGTVQLDNTVYHFCVLTQ